MNILPLIQMWLANEANRWRFAGETPTSSHREREDSRFWADLPRENVRSWLEQTDWYQANCAGKGSTDLALDCLAAAGIGREAEMTQTVYCRCTDFANA